LTPRGGVWLDFDVAGRLEVVTPVESGAQSLASSLGLDPDSSHFLGLAVREATTNAIRHGCPDGEARVKITLQVVAGRALIITVRDRGPGFDPKSLPDPSRPEHLKKGSGRGVFYMRSFCDRVSFRFPKQGGTVVRLEKRLPQRSSGNLSCG